MLAFPSLATISYHSPPQRRCVLFWQVLLQKFFLKNTSYIKSPPPPNRHKNHSLRKAKSVEKLGGGGVHVTCSKLKLIKYVSTEEKDDILEELDL